jgi:hypothetical protein
MSTNEFEQQENKEDLGDPDRSIQRRGLQRRKLPGDFSPEEMAFAADLKAIFSAEKEELPPYYVQTLLEAENERYTLIEPGFEYKTNARVFRRLKLARRLFYPQKSVFRILRTNIVETTSRRAMLLMATAFTIIMLLTVAFTGPSFAEGVSILLRGTHGSGVLTVNTYPTTVRTSANSRLTSSFPATRQISLFSTQQQLHFGSYWPQFIPTGFDLKHINLYVGLDQQWSDGPMLEFEYSVTDPSAAKGTGEIWVREFKPRADVLQLVKQGASTPIQVDESDRALAIYVDGEWMPRAKGAPVWVYGQRSELIYQIDGVVFWIVGNQHDGIGETQLMQIAQGLAPTSFDSYNRVTGLTLLVTQMSKDVPGPFTNDVILVSPEDGGDGPYYISVSSYEPSGHTR